MSWWSYRPYVSVAERRAKAMRKIEKLAKKGQKFSPVKIAGRKIVATFWGKAWCDNLESYSDFSNRLPRGRTYVRNGSVVDLQIEPGGITALVRRSDCVDDRAAAGQVVAGSDGSHHAPQRRDVPRSERDLHEVLLPRLGDDVQARGCGAVRGGGQAGPPA